MGKQTNHITKIQELCTVSPNFPQSMFINQRRKCKCSKRWMDVWIGDIMFEEDWKVIDNLIRFVNSCECMKSKTKQ